MDPQSKTIYIVQHMEQYLFEWCLAQYLQMKKYLTLDPSAQLWITNSNTFLNYHLNTDNPKDKIQDNHKQLNIFLKQFQIETGKYRIIPLSVTQLLSTLSNPVCMLDMRAEKPLSSSEKWGTIVFGGILGDHPPRDRPAPVRKNFTQIRHLGDLQLATDTAVLVSRLILHNKKKLQDIPMIREPTIKGQNLKGEKTSVQMEGFSYISHEMNIETGQLQKELTKKEKKQIYMSEGVRKLLLQQDLSAQKLM